VGEPVRTPDFPPYPAAFRAEAFTDAGPRAEGFLSVASTAYEQGYTVDEALELIEEKGWEIRAHRGQLWYRPAVVTRMGQRAQVRRAQARKAALGAESSAPDRMAR
jgi:hypothetical protein